MSTDNDAESLTHRWRKRNSNPRSPWKEHFFETGPEPGDDKLAGRLPPDFDVKCHETSLENDRRQRFCERGRLTASGPVWCSISASSLAPSRTTVIEIQIQVMNPMIAPSEP